MNEENSPLNEKSKVSLQTKSQAETTLDVTSLPKRSDAPTLDTSVVDEQWAAMTQDWQTQPFVKTDMSALVKQTKRSMNRAKALLAFDVIGTVFLLLAVGYGYFIKQWQTPTLIYLGIAGFLSILFVCYEIKIRLASWRLFEINPENIIENAIANCQASIQYIKLIKLSCYALIPLMNWYIVEIVTLKEKPLLFPLLLSNSFILVMFLITHYFHVKKNKELLQIKSHSSE